MTWLVAGGNLACGASSSPGTPLEPVPDAQDAHASGGDDGHHQVHDDDVAPVAADALDVEMPDVHALDAQVSDTQALDTEASDATPLDTEASGADVGVTEDVAEPTVISLIDNTVWALVDVDGDPFVVDGGPSPDLCPESDIQWEYTPDGIWLDVSTEGCAWATLQQPLLHAVAAGDLVRVTVVHFEIYAGDTDYTLRVALGADAEIIWTETVALGAGYEVIQATVSPLNDHAEGAPIWYHVSNHGENNWSLVAIDLLVP